MLRGKRIVLRSLQDSDLKFLSKIENDHNNWQFGSEQKEYSHQDLSDYIKNADIDISIAKQYRFVIDLDNMPIGFIDLFDYSIDAASIGVIITKEERGKGMAQEALNLLLDYSFSYLKIKKLAAITKKNNISSRKLFISCGFQLEQEFQELQHFIKLADKK